MFYAISHVSVEDKNIYKYKSGAIAFDLWQVKSGTIFDDIIVTDSIEEAKKFAEESFAKKQGPEKDAKKVVDDEEAKKMEEEMKKKAPPKDKAPDEEDVPDSPDHEIPAPPIEEDSEHEEL